MDAKLDKPIPSRAVPTFDTRMGHHTGITLTGRPPQQGARVSVSTPYPNLDAVISPPLGWHW